MGRNAKQAGQFPTERGKGGETFWGGGGRQWGGERAYSLAFTPSGLPTTTVV